MIERAERGQEEGGAQRSYPLRDDELEAVSFGDDLNLLHRVDDEVRAAVLDLRPLVARADSNNRRARGNARANTRWRVFKDDTALRVVPELLRGEQKRVGRGLARLEALVVRGDRDLWRGDANAGHAAVR